MEVIDRLIGGQIAAMRQAAGFTSEELGHRVGEDLLTVSRWEAGDLRIKAGELFRVTEALGCSVRDIYEPLQPTGHVKGDLAKAVSVEGGDLS